VLLWNAAWTSNCVTACAHFLSRSVAFFCVRRAHRRAPRAALRAQSGYTPLCHAAWKGQTEAAKVLLDKKAQPNASGLDGYSALILAARDGHVDVAKLLLEKGADKNAKTKARRAPRSPCPRASVEQRARCCLLVCVSDARTRQEGYTALIMAAEGGHMEMVRLLMSKGAAVTEFNSVIVRQANEKGSQGHGMDQV